MLSNETKRQIYDQYGSMGLQLAEQFGEENIKAYLLANSKWCKFFMIFCFCITGCCCCLCCCCCCNWCCGKCKPKTPDYDYDDLPVHFSLYILIYSSKCGFKLQPKPEFVYFFYACCKYFKINSYQTQLIHLHKLLT